MCQLLNGINALIMCIACMGGLSMYLNGKTDKPLSACLQIPVCGTRFTDKSRFCVLSQITDDLTGFGTSGFLIPVKQKFQSSARIDTEILICLDRSDRGDQAAFHIVDTRPVKLVSLFVTV